MIDSNDKIEYLAGIGPATAFKLRQAGVASIDGLMAHCVDAGARRQLSARTGINPEHLQRWAAMASLVRRLALDAELAGRLVDIGIGDPATLAQADARQLEQRLARQSADRRKPHTPVSIPALQDLIRRAGRDR